MAQLKSPLSWKDMARSGEGLKIWYIILKIINGNLLWTLKNPHDNPRIVVHDSWITIIQKMQKYSNYKETCDHSSIA